MREIGPNQAARNSLATQFYPKRPKTPSMFPGLVFSVIFRTGSRSYLENVN